MSDGTYPPFATALRSVLARRHVNQSDLATSIGVNHSAISRLCCGHRLPGWGTVARIIDELDLGGTEDEVALLFAAVDSARGPQAKEENEAA